MGPHTGDTVVVKPGTLDPDLNIDIGGWQGRVEQVDNGTVLLKWDSITLRKMGVEIAIQCENQNLDWEWMTLATHEVRKGASRDTEADRRRVADMLRAEMMDDPRIDAEQKTD